jgi:hypothetical protein
MIQNGRGPCMNVCQGEHLLPSCEIEYSIDFSHHHLSLSILTASLSEFFPCRSNSLSSMSSRSDQNRPMNLLFTLVLFLSSALKIKLKSPMTSHSPWMCWHRTLSSSRKAILSTLSCGPYAPVKAHSEASNRTWILTVRVNLVRLEESDLKWSSKAAI